jgi:hypothetical protein
MDAYDTWISIFSSTIYAMFTEWLLQQEGRKDNVGMAAKLCWAEMNNGMVPRKELGLFFWQGHWQHRGKPDYFRFFVEAYLEYKADSTKA